MHRICGFLLICGSALQVIGCCGALPARKNVVCYFTAWGQYYSGKGKFTPANLDLALCTHINFAFAGLKIDQVVWTDPQVDPKTVAGVRAAVARSGAKVLLSVGGGGYPSTTFSAMTRTKARRAVFIRSAVQLLRQHGLQGLDLDWEVPGDWGGNAQYDKATFVALLDELRAAFVAEANVSKKPRLLLSAAVGASLYYLPHSYNVPAISKALDIINVMTYDYAGPGWMNTTGLLAPLTGPAGSQCVQSNIMSWIKAGADPKKITLGIPTYWITWKLQSATSHGIGAKTLGKAPGGPYTTDPGALTYYEAVALPKVQKFFSTGSQAWYYMSGSTWASGDTPDTAARKGALAKKLGLGGVMFWELSQDAFQGKQYPLIRAAAKAANG